MMPVVTPAGHVGVRLLATPRKKQHVKTVTPRVWFQLCNYYVIGEVRCKSYDATYALSEAARAHESTLRLTMQRASTLEVVAQQHWLHETEPLHLTGTLRVVQDRVVCSSQVVMLKLVRSAQATLDACSMLRSVPCTAACWQVPRTITLSDFGA